MTRFPAVRLLLSALTVAILGLARVASAQNIVEVDAADRETGRDDEFEFWINREDCLTNYPLQFRVTVSSDSQVSEETLQVWAAETSDCLTRDDRLNDAGSCWLVYSAPKTGSSWDDVLIKAQDLVAQRRGTGEVLRETTAAVCNKSGETKVKLNFMFVRDGMPFGTPKSFLLTGFDVDPPSPPDNVSAKGGENRIHVSWDDISDSTLAGYRLYCDPAPGNEVVVDSGTSSVLSRQVTEAGAFDAGFDAAVTDAGSDGAAITDAGSTGDAAATDGGETCSDGLLKPGMQASDQLAAYFCGKAGGETAVSGVARDLRNGVKYGVAVVPYDNVGNLGVLSEIDCATPEIVVDFYEFYKAVGGDGGGGFCSTSNEGGPITPVAVLGVLGAAGALRRRSVRRARAARSTQ
jgi:hypothetical protein